MASFLYRLGRFAFRRRWLIVGLWLAILAAAATGAATLSGSTSDAFRIPGAPSQEAIDLLQERFPQASADGATARVVFAAPAGQQLTGAATKAAVEQVVAELRQAPQVASVNDPFQSGTVNQDATVGFAQATYRVPAVDLTDGDRDALTGIADRARDNGLGVEVGGDALETQNKFGAGEVIGVPVAAVVLAITFGSLLAAGLPLLTALFGIGIGISLITAATGFIDLSSTTPVLALMLGLAVSIDYALFIVSRYRHELAEGHEPEEATGRAVGTAGSAVVFAGLTVIIALAALWVVGVPFLTQMGLAAAGTVAVSVVIALTLLPALLGFAGRRIHGKRARTQRTRNPEAGTTNFGTRWARAIARRPVATLLIAVAALGVVAIPTLDLQLGIPDDGTAATDTTQRKAYDLLATGFGAGFNGPLTVVVDTPAGAAKTTAEQIVQKITALPDVTTAATTAVNPAGDTALLTVIPTSGPGDTATKDLVHAIRHLDGTITGASIGVTGLTAINIDVSTKLADALLPYLAVVVGLAFLLLMLVFRSVLVPIKATLGFLLSLAATSAPSWHSSNGAGAPTYSALTAPGRSSATYPSS
jgi:RND superfamily putative drug exporter